MNDVSAIPDPQTVDYPRMNDNEDRDSNLRRVAGRIPPTVFILLVVNFCERFAFFGVMVLFQNYIQNPLPPGGNGAGAPGSVDDPYPAGALDMGQSVATALQLCIWATATITPLPTGIIADSKWGKLRTIAFGLSIDLIGMIVLTLTALPSSIASGYAFKGWAVGATFFAVGTGCGIVCLLPLMADQVKQTKPHEEELRSGERVLVDSSLTITRIYHLSYWAANVGSIAAIIPATQLERRVGFWVAFLTSTCVLSVGLVSLLGGTKSIHVIPPQENVILETWSVISLLSGRFMRSPWSYIGDKTKSDIWNYAKPSYALHSESTEPTENILAARITWKDDFVDELKRTFEVCQVFLFLPLYFISYNQMTTNMISQAATLSTNGAPNDILQSFNALSLITFIPIMELLVYPALRRVGIDVRPIFRISLGFFLAAAAMVYSAVMQYFIYQTNPCGDMASSCATKSSLSVWLQVPSYVLIALSEIFAAITGLEYAYSEAPARMKSVIISIFLTMMGFGAILDIFLAPFARDPYLIMNYGILAATTFFSGLLFYYTFRRRDYNKNEQNHNSSHDESDGEDQERSALLRTAED